MTTSVPMSQSIKKRVQYAAQAIGASNPLPYVGGLIERSFELPEGDSHYAANYLAPGTAPFEPSYSEAEPNALRFTLEPLGPVAPPIGRRDEATREMRRLVRGSFGNDALKWFDGRSEEWRALFSNPRLHFGAWFGNAYDGEGLYSSKVYYELTPSQLHGLPAGLSSLVRTTLEAMPSLVPLFTTIACRRTGGSQRVTFLHKEPLRLVELDPLMRRLGLGHQLAGVMQVLGLALGGRFDLPERSLFVGVSGTRDEPEVKLEVMLGMLPDLPESFLNLLSLGLSERPRELQGLQRWLQAFTPETYSEPGNFSVLSVRVGRDTPARVSLYLRPVEFELHKEAAGQYA
jgi:hypothetical protein